MKLLIVTQKIDINDPILGFFHQWVVEFSKSYESIQVICLYKGKYKLPNNVKVLSLGKERGVLKIKYILNFYKYILLENKNYDKVFVHMNQEYVLLGSLIWFILNKDIFMWRNHHDGTILTDIAALFCKKVFCTSVFSYTAKYKKTQIMPVGVDLVNFKESINSNRLKQSILFLGRISPVKRPHMLISVVTKIKKEFINMTCSIYGDPLLKDYEYYNGLRESVSKNNQNSFIRFHKGIPNIETVAVYSSHDIFVNLSSSGMYDKTIFEAIACGCLILASNRNLIGQIDDCHIFNEGDVDDLTQKIKILLSYTPEERLKAVNKLQNFVKKHSLIELSNKISNIV